MNGLSDKQIDEFTERLAALRKRLAHDIHDELVKSGREDHLQLAGLVHDTKDQSLSDRLSLLDSTVAEMHRSDFNDVNFALQRLTSGKFNQCIDCGEEIGLARLTASPTAKRCIDCQTVYEDLNQSRGDTKSSRRKFDEN